MTVWNEGNEKRKTGYCTGPWRRCICRIAGCILSRFRSSLTYNMKSPYPEEFNRQAIGLTASLHFAPTQKAADALLKEGKDPEQIFVTGNTGIDARTRNDFYHPEIEWA